MNNGYAVLQWIYQNKYTVKSIANKIGYARPVLSNALNNEQISVRMADLLYEHYGLQVIPTVGLPWQSEKNESETSQQSVRGRTPGRGGVKTSKLDQYSSDIFRRLAEGQKQKDIAAFYQTSPSNLHEWVKSRKKREQMTES